MSVVGPFSFWSAGYPDPEEEFEARKRAFAQTVPDYAQVVANANVGVPQHVTDYLKTSPLGPALGYHLARNLETCRRIAWMPRPEAIKALKKLESRLQAPPLRLVHCVSDSGTPIQISSPFTSPTKI